MNERITISPKQRFLAVPSIASAHSDIMASPAFITAASAALLEYQHRAFTNDPTILAITASKLRGAQEFLTILLNLGLPEERAEALDTPTLTPPESRFTKIPSPYA